MSRTSKQATVNQVLTEDQPSHNLIHDGCEMQTHASFNGNSQFKTHLPHRSHSSPHERNNLLSVALEDVQPLESYGDSSSIIFGRSRIEPSEERIHVEDTKSRMSKKSRRRGSGKKSICFFLLVFLVGVTTILALTSALGVIVADESITKFIEILTATVSTTAPFLSTTDASTLTTAQETITSERASLTNSTAPILAPTILNLLNEPFEVTTDDPTSSTHLQLKTFFDVAPTSDESFTVDVTATPEESIITVDTTTTETSSTTTFGTRE
ncbi:unnamed protein product [Adineta ricciae]|uniref:Uncharacterized protein n=1 Tax=Adineta ricciae TaxID=249248 RepID=A0A816CE49_ADIRI|nr:unnamed protein product [Adineta ricciae]